MHGNTEKKEWWRAFFLGLVVGFLACYALMVATGKL